MPLDSGWVTKLLHNLFFFHACSQACYNAGEKVTTSHEKSEKWKDLYQHNKDASNPRSLRFKGRDTEHSQ